MTDHERLQALLRHALPSVTAQRPSRDLWPAVVEHVGAHARVSRFDLGLAVTVAIALFMVPETLWLIAYHL